MPIYETIVDMLMRNGEFSDADEAEEYLSRVIAQQSKEAISPDILMTVPIASDR